MDERARRQTRRAISSVIESLESRCLLSGVALPNTDIAHAMDLGQLKGQYVLNDQANPSENYFVFDTALAANAYNYVEIDFSHTAGDLDLELLDSNGDVLDSATGVADSEQISLVDRPAGTYYLHVFNAANPDYTLTINAPTDQDDVLEASGAARENDYLSTATDLGLIQGRYIHDNLAALDEDWYTFQSDQTGGTGNFARIQFDTSLGDLDLALYDSNSNLLASSTGISTVEDISLDGLAAGTYYIRVYGYNGATNPDYSLIIDTPVSVDDTLELSSQSPSTHNNYYDAATNLGSLSGANIYNSLVAADDDFYSFTLDMPATADNYARIDFLNRAGDLDLYLLDSNGNQLKQSATVLDYEQISLEGLAAGDYIIWAHPYNGAINSDYTLTIDAPTVTYAPDRLEPNDSFDTATDLGQLSGVNKYENLTIHTPATGQGNDEDFFKFSLDGEGTANDYVWIHFSAAAGDLELALYDQDGQLLDYSTGATDDESVSLQGYPAGTYYARVFGYNGEANAYELLVGAPETTFPADAYESNDDLAHAGDLQTVAGPRTVPNLTIHSATDEDFFQFRTAVTGTAADSVSIDFANATGDLDMELLDSSGQRLALSDSSADGEAISLQGMPADTYYIHVYGYKGATNRYSLRIDGPANQPVRPDAYESQEPIVLQQSQTIEHLSIHNPADWSNSGTASDTFTFTTLDAGGVNDYVEIRFNQAAGALGMTLSGNGITPLAAPASRDMARLSLAGLAAGTYTATMSGLSGATNPDYSFSIRAPFTVSQSLPLWTFLVYMDADNSLDFAAADDVNEMEAARLPRDVQVGILWDGATTAGAGILQGDNDINTVSTQFADWGELNMGDPATLQAFIQWGKANLPAQNYALILWDHGGATLGSMQDDTSGGDLLTLPEMQTALAGQGINVLGFDACLMATAEVAYTVSGSVDYMVASEDTEGAAGWDYTNTLNAVANQLPASAQQVASIIVNANRNTATIATLSAVNVSTTSLKTPLFNLIKSFTGASSAEWNAAAAARDASPEYYFPMFHDLGTFLRELASRTSTTAIRNAANAALSAYNADIVNNYADSSTGGTGLSIYLPSPEDGLWSDYSSLDLPYDTGWFRFVSYFANRTGGASSYSRDWAESNDLRSTATDLGALPAHGMVFPLLSISASTDVDWFRFTTLATGVSGDSVRLTFNNAAGNLSLFLYNAAGTLLGRSETASNTERISLQGRPAAEYFIRVIGAGGATNSDYTLTIDAPDESQSPANDRPAKAQPLPLNAFHGGLVIDAAQPQWYSLGINRVPLTDPLTIDANFTNPGDVQLALYAANDTVNPVAVSQPIAGGARLIYPNLGANSFYLKVTGPASGSAAFSLLASHQAPKIVLQGNQKTIASGDTSPATTDWTDFGSVGITGSTFYRDFVIRNTGVTTLNLTGSPRVRITGASAADFQITRLPATSVAPGGWTWFRVQFDPTAVGRRSATISVASDDRAHSPYAFSIQGTGVLAPYTRITAPINGRWLYVENNQVTPAVSFGSVRWGGAMPTRQFRVYNFGDATLSLRLQQRDLPAGFTLVQSPPASLAPRKWGTFTIGMQTTALASRNVDIKLYTNDPQRNPFKFRVSGTITRTRSLAIPASQTASPVLAAAVPTRFSTGPRVTFWLADEIQLF